VGVKGELAVDVRPEALPPYGTVWVGLRGSVVVGVVVDPRVGSVRAEGEIVCHFACILQ